MDLVQTITASFATRRDADMAVEQLIQKLGVAAGDITTSVAAAANNSGVVPSGSDVNREKFEKVQLAGRLVVTANVDASLSEDVRDVCRNYKGRFD